MPKTVLDWALHYAAAGYAVLPLYEILEPAPPEIVEAFHNGDISKKEAVQHATCACGDKGGRERCRSPGKHPRIPNGASGASLDPDTIVGWFRRWPGSNVGIRLPSDRVALDFDTYEPGVGERLLRFDDSYRGSVRQSSGAGEHRIFEGVPPGFRFNSTFQRAAGVDIIHSGHRYLVAAPSIHWTGARYAWQTSVDALARAPEELLADCGSLHAVDRQDRKADSRRPQPARGREWDNVSVDDLPPPPCPHGTKPEAWARTLALTLPPAIADDEEGSREHGHVTLQRTAGYLVSGLALDPSVARAILWEHYNPRCIPPWSERERRDFDRIVARVAESEPSGDLLPGFAQAPDEAPLEPEPLSASIAKIGELVDLAAPLSPLNWRIDNVLAPGKVSLLSARPEAGKSPLALWIALCVALGVPVFPNRRDHQWVTKQAPVLYLDYETGTLTEERMQRMCNALGVARGELAPAHGGGFHLFHADGTFDANVLRAIHAYVEQTGCRLCIVDTYVAALAGDIDQNSGQFAHYLRQLGKMSKALDLTVLLTMHQKKGASADIEGISGNISAAGAAQTILSLTPQDKGLIEVTCVRHPRAKLRPFSMQWVDLDPPGDDPYDGVMVDGLSWGLEPQVIEPEHGGPQQQLVRANAERRAMAEAQAAQLADELIAALRRHKAMPKKQLFDAALVSGEPALRALRELVKRGRVRQEKSGNSTIYSLRGA